MDDKQGINSQSYWQDRFNRDWSLYRGHAQTAFFAELALQMLPEPLTRELQTATYTLCDAGCAVGEAVDLWARAFPGLRFSGLDFAASAIEQAQQRYPAHEFLVGDVRDLPQAYDVIFSSNTLEHFEDPRAVMEALMPKANRYLVILVPFRERDRTAEHHVTFDYSTFPLRLGSGQLVAFRACDCATLPGSCWGGEQAMAVYAQLEKVDLSAWTAETFLHT